MAYETGRRIVEMAYEDLKPSDILSPASFRNAMAVVAAIGGSTNAQPHLVAMALPRRARDISRRTTGAPSTPRL